jgi:NADH:ubiquinone oxidoreductase subunit 6 (subunit J)
LTVANFIFYVLAGVSLFSALMAVTLRNLFHCALFLVVAMFGEAGLFLYLNSEFLAAVQVIIYVGAVTVFIFFGIMFTRNVMDEKINVMNRQFLLALVAAVFFGFIALKAVHLSSFGSSDHPLILTQQTSPDSQGVTVTTVAASMPSGNEASYVDVYALATDLLNPGHGFAYAFEFVSILLLSALVGAIVVARKDPS